MHVCQTGSVEPLSGLPKAVDRATRDGGPGDSFFRGLHGIEGMAWAPAKLLPDLTRYIGYRYIWTIHGLCKVTGLGVPSRG